MKITLNPKKRTQQFEPTGDIGFGTLRTDHMFLAEYKDGQWQNERIVPYQNLSLAPGATVLHYGQECFEGIKIVQNKNGELLAGRLEENAKRLNFSAEKLCMPNVPQQLFCSAVQNLADVDRMWLPQIPHGCFYVRPFMFGTTDQVSVMPAEEYTFCVILSPSGQYFPFDKMLKLLITQKYHRVGPGGVGDAKAGGNYATSFRATKYAHEKDCQQVLYLDSTNSYLEEAGVMNHFHVKDGELIIPKFTDTILRSITAVSLIELANHLGIKVKQEQIDADKFIADIKSGKITECGGIGTAASISPVGSYYVDETQETIVVADGTVGPITQKLYDTYTKIQRGEIEDPFGWMKIIGKEN